MRILIVDDSIDKISELTKLIHENQPEAIIETAENISNAISLFQNEDTYNLAVIDIFLPLRKGQDILKNGGELLLKELYRKAKVLKIPNYIIGFTQYDDALECEFSSIWRIIKFDYSSERWKTEFNQLLTHINNTNFMVTEVKEIIPVIYVEGITDLNYLNIALELFYPKYKDLIEIKSQRNAGANWVASQVAIWAISKMKYKTGDYIMSIGLLDADEAGNKAKKDLFDRIQTENEQKCFKILNINQKYNQELINFYSKGCKIEVEIESLFPINIINHAEKQGWLEHRSSSFIENPKGWKQHEETSLSYIKKLGFNDDQNLYLKKVKRLNKQDFSNYIINLDTKLREDIFINFKSLIKDILIECKIFND
ncbi:response regulator [Gaetbulibacter sp. M235]|uniref:response regulator transcription factor n=1 Tax=Gaetbulibacter sp. M235 TaxID=3126510 RepID=UPI00374F2EE6